MPALGGEGWLGRWARALAGEALATALLVWLGMGALVPASGGPPRPLTDPALAFGFLVTALVEVFGPVSGAHMNPAVTLAAVVAGRLPPAPGALYVVAQLAGGALGAGALWAVQPPGASPAGHVCTQPAGGPGAAVVVEAALTGVLVLVCCALWAAHDPAAPDRSASLKLGATVAGVIYAGGLVSGASLNPARSFGPALIEGEWAYQWVYWVGPLLGAALCAALHRWALSPAKRPAGARPAEEGALPLAAKHEDA